MLRRQRLQSRAKHFLTPVVTQSCILSHKYKPSSEIKGLLTCQWGLSVLPQISVINYVWMWLLINESDTNSDPHLNKCLSKSEFPWTKSLSGISPFFLVNITLKTGVSLPDFVQLGVYRHTLVSHSWNKRLRRLCGLLLVCNCLQPEHSQHNKHPKIMCINKNDAFNERWNKCICFWYVDSFNKY